MNCHEVQQALIEAAYGELPVSRRRAVEAHRATCRDCGEAWASLQGMRAALDQWHDVAPPADLRARILARVAAEHRTANAGVGGRRGLLSTGLSVGIGLAMMALTVVLLAPWLPLDAVTPRALLLCGALWGGTYVGLCRLALSEPRERERPWVFERSRLTGAAGLAVVAVAVATLVVVLVARLPVASGLAARLSPLGTTLVGGGTVALFALLISTAALGPALGLRTRLQALLASCLFLVAMAPGLLMFCVPFTLGAYAGVLLAVGVGAGAGGVLGAWLRLPRPVHV